MISVIIPVYNAAENITETITKIKNSVNDKVKYEIIVIDNGSEDKTPEIVKELEGVTLLTETNYLNSPYSCRNRGIEIARGDYLIFLDATCTPTDGWLNNFLRCIEHSTADLLGGDIRFSVLDDSTVSEFADAVSNVNIELSIDAGHAMTANLLVRRKVVDVIGKFPEGIRSGGDVRWTRKAVRRGFNLEFCKEAVVFKNPRKFKGLLKKSWRVGKWQPIVWREHGHFLQSLFKATIKIIVPPNIFRLRKKAVDHSYNVGNLFKWISVIMVVWLNQWVRTSGAYYGLIRMIKNK